MASSQTHPVVAAGAPVSLRTGEAHTLKMMMSAPTTQPKKVPRIKRLGRLPRLGAKPHARGKRYWLTVTKQRRRPWKAKVMSLNWTVGVRPL